MVTDLLFRVACHGGSDEPLNIHLKRISDAAYTRKTLGGAEIDGEVLAPVIQESHDGDCRREIMKHVRCCLSEASGKRWHRIYGGLALTQALMQHASHELVMEVAHGHHFDLVQKVSFLEHFDAAARGCSDRRAQHAVRTKASELLATLVPQLQKASAEELPRNAGLNGKEDYVLSGKDDSSKDNVSTSTGSTTASSSDSSIPSGSDSTSPSASIEEEASSQRPVLATVPETPVTPPRPPRRPPIDEAFSSLRDWLDAGGYTSGSAAASPRDSNTDDSDWEPLGQLPMQRKISAERSPFGNKSDCSDPADAFFTPMPTPAAPDRSKAPKMSL